MLQTSFAAADRILQGFSAQSLEGEPEPGDELLFGVRLARADMETVWFVRLRVLATDVEPGATPDLAPTASASEADGGTPRREPAPDWSKYSPSGRWRGRWRVGIQPESLLLRLDVYDRGGALVSQTTQYAPQGVLCSGLYRVCELHQQIAQSPLADRAELTDAQAQTVYYGVSSLLLIGRILWNTPHIGEIFMEIVPRPSLVSMLLNLGVKVRVNPSFDRLAPEVRALPAVRAGYSALRLPVEVVLNGRPSMRFDLALAPTGSPLGACAGVIGLDGSHVSDESTRFSIWLLAAHAARDHLVRSGRDVASGGARR